MRKGLEGNLCRCTGYHNIVRAVQAASRVDGAEATGMSTIEETPAGKHVGQAIRRKEDPRLITGRATYVDDIDAARDALHRRSCARPRRTRTSSRSTRRRRSRAPGIKAVYTGEDMSDLLAPLPMAWAPPGVEVKTPERWPLARGKVCHVGDAVAMVIGEDKYAVVDAAEAVRVEYEPLPVVIDVEEALKDEIARPRVARHEQDRTSGRWAAATSRPAFAEADVIIERRIVNHRISGAAIEPRGVIAEDRAGSLTVWSSTQVPHFLRLFFAVLLGMSEDHVRVIAPEVGGGFGSKLQIYAEEIVLRLGRAQARPPDQVGRDALGDMASLTTAATRSTTCGWARSATARSPPSTRRSSRTAARTSGC